MEWLRGLRLTLNEEKTEVILLGNPRTLIKCTFTGIHVGNTLISPSTQIRSLGVLLDSNLSMKAHVGRIRAASFARLRLIARVKKCLRQHECSMLVNSLVLLHLTYCMPLLTGISSNLLQKLQRMIDSSVRLVYGLGRWQSVQGILLKDGWLPVQSLIKLRILLLLFNVVSFKKPSFLHELLHDYTPRRQLRSESQLLLTVPRQRLSASDKAFRVVAPRLWNSLPLRMRQCQDKSFFMSKCKFVVGELQGVQLICSVLLYKNYLIWATRENTEYNTIQYIGYIRDKDL